MTAEICIGRECVKRVIAFVFITPDVPQRGAMQGDNHGFQATAKKGGGKVHEAGEISITDDGSLMYFVYQVKNGPSNYDNGIGFARRKRR